MALFKGKKMNRHSATGGGRFLPWADFWYRVRIGRCIGKEQGYKGDSAIVEFEIVESDNPEVKPGEEFSWINKLEKGDVVLGNISSFVRAGIQSLVAINEQKFVEITRVVPDIVSSEEDFDDEVEKAFGEDNPFAGLEFDLHTVPIRTRKKDAANPEGHPFTKHVWHSAAELIESVGGKAA